MPRTRNSSIGVRKSLDKSRRSEDFLSGDSTVNYIWQVMYSTAQLNFVHRIKLRNISWKSTGHRDREKMKFSGHGGFFTGLICFFHLMPINV